MIRGPLGAPRQGLTGFQLCSPLPVGLPSPWAQWAVAPQPQTCPGQTPGEGGWTSRVVTCALGRAEGIQREACPPPCAH